MSLQAFISALDQLLAGATSAFDGAADRDALEAARIEYLGAKSGKLKSAQKGLGAVAGPDKPVAGKKFNDAKTAIEAAFESAQTRLSAAPTKKKPGEQFDTSLPGTPLRLGRLHPITQTINELKEIMGRLGFTAADGPEIEDEYHNFEALNIPEIHPARDPLDNFYLVTASVGADSRLRLPADGASKNEDRSQETAPTDAAKASPLLLRSQTSTVQIRVMEATRPPVRIISLGRVYRPDPPDRTHYPMFHQMEGLYIDTHVTMADLKSVLRLFATSYLGQDVQVRFRPSFFPFTEPSVEVDMHWNGRWMEFGGAGMVDPNVLRAVGYDPEQVTGFAFGLGVERLCMRRHNITDIRYLFENDVRFLRQF